MVRDKSFYKTIFAIALPSAFQALISFLVVFVDDKMVSSLGDGVTQFAAVSQSNKVTMLVTATLTGLVSGSSVLISQYWGKRDMERIKRIFSIVAWLTFIVALAFVLMIELFPYQILGIMTPGGEDEILNFAVQYFTIACLAFIPYAITTAFVGMLRSVEVVRITLIITCSSLFINIFFNYVLIFGKFGFPALGVRGAAIATFIARLSEMIIVLLYTFKGQKVVKLKPSDLLKFDRRLMKDYRRYGLPVGLTDMQWSLVGLFKGVIIGKLGGVFIAANSIADNMANLGTLFTFALAGGACVVVGKTVGAGDYEKTREYSKTIQIMFFFIGLIMAALVYFIRVPFANIFGNTVEASVEAKSLAVRMIALMAFTLVGTSYHASCFVGINRGAGDSRFVMMVDMICGWLVVLPLTFLAAFVFQWPLPIVFLMTRIDQCFKWIIAFFRLRGDKWIKNITHEDDGFGVIYTD